MARGPWVREPATGKGRVVISRTGLSAQRTSGGKGNLAPPQKPAELALPTGLPARSGRRPG